MSSNTEKFFEDTKTNPALADAMKNANNENDVIAIGEKFGYTLTLDEVVKQMQTTYVDWSEQLKSISAAGCLTRDPGAYTVSSAEWNNYWNHYGGSYGGE
ncbi:hypothetical protein SPONN_1614 [uncultured Candidatus Thioglobus sp.]|nr:hypothetical protein SPONN_1614 [uncultured Candidatus Thioglobus sp.]